MADGENQVFNALNSGAAFMRNRTQRQRETQDFQDEQTARPLIGPALTGNPQAVTALGVAAPSLLMKITPHLQRMDATQLARSKAIAEARGAFASGILSLDPKDQPQGYATGLQQLKELGHDTSHMPQTFTPDTPGMLRSMRAMSTEYQKHLMDIEKKKTAPGKAGGAGGGAYDAPSWGGPAPNIHPSIINGPPAAGRPDEGDNSGPAPVSMNVPASEPVAQAPNARIAAPNTAPPVDDQNLGPAPVDWQAGGPDQTAPAPAQAPAQPNVPAGNWQPMGHRDPQGKLVPAMFNGQPVFRNTQTGELGPAPQQASLPAAIPDAPPTLPETRVMPHMLSVQTQGMPRFGGTGRTEMAQAPEAVQAESPIQLAQAPGGMPPASGPGAVAAPPPMVGPVPTGPTVTPPPAPRAATPAAPGAVVHEIPPGYEPIRQGGIPVVTKQGYIPLISRSGPPILLKPSDAKPEKSTAPQGYEPDPARPGALRAIAGGPADLTRKMPGGIPPELANLHGDQFRQGDWWQNQPVILRNNVEGLLDGSLTLSSLSKRTGVGVDPYTMQGIAKQIDPTWSGNAADARKRFETIYMTNGQGAQIQSAANTALPHMATMHDALSALAGGDTSGQTRAGQIVINAARNYFGDPKIASVNTARTLFGPEVAKLVRGGGSLNESEEKAATALSDPNATVQQQQASLTTLSEMMRARISTLEYMAKQHEVPEARIKAYLSPAARDAMERVHNQPIPGSQEPSLFDRGKALFERTPRGGPQPTPAVPNDNIPLPPGLRRIQ